MEDGKRVKEEVSNDQRPSKFFTLTRVSLRLSCSQNQAPSTTNQDDHQAEFYKHYHEVAAKFDQEFLKKYNDDLDTTLIFVSSLYEGFMDTC